MKVTAQEEYGLRCMLQLARNFGREPLVSRMISEQEGLSIDYVTKLLMLLRRANLVESVRGTKGGYALSRDPHSITIGQVIQSLSTEGLIVTSADSHHCNHFSGQLDECVHLEGCGIRPVWVTLSKYISGLLEQISLADLMGEEVEVMGVFEHVANETEALDKQI
ncbi:MAG: Rrf2 family transcriptional regulator [Candidatus Latescibacteria bacterium]|nr:Rrf2 family transcriptional regulator [Candidatus Latescibacterota bacterium]